MALDDLEEPARVLGAGVGVEQRLDVPADRGQRGPELVRDVGDEVATDPIGASQVRDVVEDEHRPTVTRRAHRRGPATNTGRARD